MPEAMMAASCPGVKRDPFGNNDSVDGAGVPLVMVKFDYAVEIIMEAEEDNDDNAAVAELTGGGANEGETRLPVSLDSKEEVSGACRRWRHKFVSRGWYPVRRSRHGTLALSLKSRLLALRKDGIGDNRFPSLSLVDNLPVANHLIQWY